ncbi:DNA polymerase III subunit gamma and tau [Herbiconiux flava]
MIGQSQVTDPLMTALRTNRVNHAYLFSGPRGCGKTTSARILARCLNCAEGPTDTPCGVCPSCVELGRDGPGSLDVVEIDAASHNGVDDARDLRERAVFAPARDRFKIFILDEAHMVTPQGFNALLKIVEEPPEHIKFIFATTEPDKVIGTIRSRTHHYPFRLIPPAQLLEYVQSLCESEGVDVAPGVLPLVVRAGGGSARDTLSLLDQLIAGSENNHVDYERAVALLGYTHGALLSEAVDALGTHDGAAVFDAVDRVIQTGQDPRRFVEDLLERLRDIIVVSATREQAASVLRGVPADDLEVMRRQAALFGHAELSRVADIVNSSLSEMTGATSPRLHLELMMARALVPAADDTQRGALARVERLERRIGVDAGDADSGVRGGAAAPSSGAPSSGVPASGAPSSGAPAPAHAGAPAVSPSAPPASEPPANTVPDAQTAAASWNIAAPASAPPPSETRSDAPQSSDASDSTHRSTPDVVAVPPAATPVQAVAAAAGEVTLQQLKDAWPEILEAVQKAKMTAWLVVFTAQVRALDGDVLTLAFPSENDVASFKERSAPGQGVSEYLRQAILDVLGLRVKYIARVDTTLRPHDAPATLSAAASASPAAAAPSASPVAPSASPAASPADSASPSASASQPVPSAAAPSISPSPTAAPAPDAASGTRAPAAESAGGTPAPAVAPASGTRAPAGGAPAPSASQAPASADPSAPAAAVVPSPTTASESTTASTSTPAAAESDATASAESPSGSAAADATPKDEDEDDDEFDEDEELEDLPPEEELAPEPKAIVDSSGWTVPGLNENTAAAPAEPGPESDSAEVARMRAQLAALKNTGPAAPQTRGSSAERGPASTPSSAPTQRPQTAAPAQRPQQAPSQHPQTGAPAQRPQAEAPDQRRQADAPAQRPPGGAATTSWDVVAIPTSADEEPPPYDEPMPSDEPDLPPSLADILPSGGAPFGAPAGRRLATSPEQPAGQRPATSPDRSAGRGSGESVGQPAGRGSGAPVEQPGAQGTGPQDARGAAAGSGGAPSGSRAGDPAARPGALRFEASGPEAPGDVPASGAQQSGAAAAQRPANAGSGGRARYGEAVVREILGANFIEEQPLPGRDG